MKPLYLIIGGLLLMIVPMLPATIEIPIPSWSIAAPAKATHGVYVYDFKKGPVPQDITECLGPLNREHGIIATTCDVSGNIPRFYEIPVAEAKRVGLPAFVFTDGVRVVNSLKAPAGAEVIEAAP